MPDDENVEAPDLSKEEEMQQYLYRLELIKSQLDGLSQQGEIFELTTNEIMRAKETLENIKNLSASSEILIPIGGDTFVYASVSNPTRILINIGAGTIIEEDTTKAIERLDGRLTNLENLNKSILQSIQKLQDQARDLSIKIQEIQKDGQGQGI